MLRRTLTLLAVLSVATPIAARADDWDDDREWEEDNTGQQPWAGGQQPDDYDVSVDMNVSGAVTFDTFQGALGPYGEWVVAGGYGRVWRPRVAAGWRPYYYGRWEWTNEGWLWASDEPWGWAAYHYGRWTYDSYYGWVWVPGYQWAPAWVAWRYSGDVVGWAPLGPGVSVYVSSYPFVDYWWTFVPCGSFLSVPVYSVAYAPGYTRRYFYATAPAPPLARGTRPTPGRPGPARPAWGGPAPRVIEQRIGRPVTPVRVVPAPSPGAARVRPGEVSVYRPDARPGRADGARGQRATPAPGAERGALAPGRGDGRVGPGAAPPARGGDRSTPGNAPPSRGGERGSSPGAAPPARGGERGGSPGTAPPARGGERGSSPGAAPPPDRGSTPGAAPPSRGGDRGSGPGAPPPSRGSAQPSRDGASYAAPPRTGGRGGAAVYGAPGQGGGRDAPGYAARSRAEARGGAGYAAPAHVDRRAGGSVFADRGQSTPAASAAPAQRGAPSARAAPAAGGADGGAGRSPRRAARGARAER
jgi:hypothetical protein